MRTPTPDEPRVSPRIVIIQLNTWYARVHTMRLPMRLLPRRQCPGALPMPDQWADHRSAARQPSSRGGTWMRAWCV